MNEENKKKLEQWGIKFEGKPEGFKFPKTVKILFKDVKRDMLKQSIKREWPW